MNAHAPPPAMRTTCPYCGVGCGVLAAPDGLGGAAIVGDPEHPANFGRLCSKGAALGETLGLETRLLHPMLRQHDGTLARIDWDQALDRVADGFARIIERDGPDAVAFYLSGQLLTEDYYVANKLMKGFIGSANVDTNSRLCMASSVAGHKRAFGADTVPGLYEDLDQADLIVLVGSNAAWCHPVLFQRMQENRRDARRQAGRDRSAPHRDRAKRPTCISRSSPAWTPRCSPGCWRISPTATRSIAATSQRTRRASRRALRARARSRPILRAVERLTGPARGRRSALLRAVRRNAARRHRVFAGREPVGAGHRQGQRDHQLPSRHRPHRPARHGAVLADRPAQRDGRARGRRARQPVGRAHEFLAARDRPGAPLLACAEHRDARRPQGRRRCSKRSSAARSRRCG